MNFYLCKLDLKLKYGSDLECFFPVFVSSFFIHVSVFIQSAKQYHAHIQNKCPK